jgi:uncharacterized protein
VFFYTLPNDGYTRVLTACEFGAMGPRFNEALFGSDPTLTLIPAEHIRLHHKTLVLAKETGSWCFFDPGEYRWYQSLNGRRLQEVLGRTTERCGEAMRDVIATLYWRGLLQIGERAFFDPGVLSAGALQQDHFLASLALTYRCNLQCAYCYVDAAPSRQERMEWDSARTILDLVLKEPFESVTIELTGGEPLLEIDLIERIVEYASERANRLGKDIDFCVQTNGTLLQGDILRRVERMGLAVGTSLDGTAPTNDRTRVFSGDTGAFEAVTGNLRKLMQRDFPLGVICVISRTNYDRFSMEIPRLSDIGIRDIKFNPIYFVGRAKGVWENLAITPEEFLHTHRSYLDGLLRGDYDCVEENTVHMLNLLGSKMHGYRCMRAQCGAGRTFFAFSPIGDVYPCGRYKTIDELRLGNAHQTENLGELWKRNPVMSALDSRTVKTIAACETCRYKSYCQGGCSLGSYFNFGSAYEVSALCPYYHGMYEDLFGRLAESPRILEVLGIDAEIYDQPVPGITEGG